MKKELLLLGAGLFVAWTAGAQYRKASFLNRSGRMYEFGVSTKFLMKEHERPYGFYLSYGREKSENKLHYWIDSEVVPGNKYQYTTLSLTNPANTIEVRGKLGLSYSMRVNLAYFLVNQGGDEKKIAPYINLAGGYILRGPFREETRTPDDPSPMKYTSDQRSGFMYGAGAGMVYRFTPAVGLRLAGTYFFATEDNGNSGYILAALQNHLSVSIGLRYKIIGED